MLFAENQGVAARRALEQAAIESADHPEVFLAFGSVALGEGRLSDARLNFEQALKQAGAGKWDAERTQVFRREAAAGLAAVAEGRGDWKTAQEHLNAWLELEPKNGQARQRLGHVLFQLDQMKDAFDAFTQAVKDAPALEPAAVSMGLLYSRKGDLKKAEDWFDYAQKVDPTSARVRRARAAWLLDVGRARAAGAEIEEAVKLDPGSKEGQQLQALIAWHLRDLAGAEKCLEPLYRDSPADPSIANLLALVLVEQDDAAKRSRGLQLAEVNARQLPQSHEALATLGWAHYRSGHLAEAEKMLRAAVAGVRTTPDIAYFLARVLADTQHTDDARKLLQTATELPGAFAHRTEAAAFLAKLGK
jgi:tetratricopeptide (TPR) repeat protein